MQEVQQLEVSLEHAKGMVALKDAVLKLSSNREFKKVILDGYFKEEASRLALLSADHSSKDHRPEIITAIQGISCLHNYLQTIVRMGEIAAREVADFEEELSDLRAEEATAGEAV